MAVRPETAQFFQDLARVSDHIGWHNASPLTEQYPTAGNTVTEVTYLQNGDGSMITAICHDTEGEVCRSVRDLQTGDFLRWPSDAGVTGELLFSDEHGTPRELTTEVLGRLATQLASAQPVSGTAPRPSLIHRLVGVQDRLADFANRLAFLTD